MNKQELISAVAEKVNFTKKDVETTINAVFEEISNSLQSQVEVKVTGFGIFTTVTRAARSGRNPSTGEAIEIPETIAVKFKPSSVLKELVKE